MSKAYNGTEVLRRTSVEIDSGEFIAFVGPSGCGKTSLLRMIADLESPDSGEITIGNAKTSTVRRSRKIGYISQSPATIPWKSAIEDVSFTQSLTGSSKFSPKELLVDFGLQDHLDKLPHQLSGGMLQRVNLASAIAHDPELLLMDEPFSALDEIKREEMGAWLNRTIDGLNKTIVFVTHSVDEAVMLADRVFVFSKAPGELIADIAINHEQPRTSQFRYHPKFSELTRQIRRILHGDTP